MTELRLRPSPLQRIGQYLFALSIGGFGVLQLVTREPLKALLPLPGNANYEFVAVVTGALLLCIAIGSLTQHLSNPSLLIIGCLFGVFFIFPHIPRVLGNVWQPTFWTVAMETLAMGCGAILMFDSMPKAPGHTAPDPKPLIPSIVRLLFGICLIVFGIQHILYTDFIVSLMPKWMPFKTYLGHAIKAAFLLAGISLLINHFTRWAYAGLAIMFLLWVLLLHGPRVIEKTSSVAEWSSFFIALAIGGFCLHLAFSPNTSRAAIVLFRPSASIAHQGTTTYSE